MKRIESRYFEWLIGFVYDEEDESRGISYRRLLRRLHKTDFRALNALDDNRIADGVDLRYRFGREARVPQQEIASKLDIYPCSILEMMIALAIRCETHIMDDPDLGNRTGQWFWNMIVSLGLSGMTDNRYDDDYISEVIDRFLSREYERDGEGGLFTIRNTYHDMRSAEIWYQAMWYMGQVWKKRI